MARAQSHNPLEVPVQFLPGIGPRRASVLTGQGITTLRDLLFLIPRRYIDRSTIVTIEDLRKDKLQKTNSSEVAGPDVRNDVTVVGEVRSFRVMGYGRKARFVLILADNTGSMQCVWFGGVQYWKKAFEVGETLAVSGQPSFFGNVLQIVHPSIDRLAPRKVEDEKETIDWQNAFNTGRLIPLYPSNQDLEKVGLDSGGLRRLMGTSLRNFPTSVPETLPQSVVRRHSLRSLGSALQAIHAPKSQQEISEGMYRLKYEEFFHFQVKLALKRHLSKTDSGGIQFDVESKLARQLVDSLPFKLTKAQIKVVNEITSDMKERRALNRLLQGDVGSGKTIVALLCMLIAIDNGYQTVFMAPTEILAEQHFRTLSSLLKSIPVNIRLLIGGQKSRLRRDVLDDIQRGSAQIVVGTHAVFESTVDFARLGFVVIDEQHRFGVLQRASLRKKGANPDVLVMTATPIPRTLSLTLYGDLDVSTIDELPKNRKPIKTVLRSDRQASEVYSFVLDQVKMGRQVYFVYPLIDESEKVDLKAATAHFERLRDEVFPELRVGLLHGRLDSGEKEALMELFKAGNLDILVATTIIEVGIDIPNATVMVIENAERFGLAQLHQLRGRVGRGADQSYCVLMAGEWTVTKAKRLDGLKTHFGGMAAEDLAAQRLATMAATTDGFKIAEIDLALRGPGDFFGTRQSGIPEFKVANILTDTRILDAARSDAFNIVAADPELSHPDHLALRDHLRRSLPDSITLLHVG